MIDDFSLFIEVSILKVLRKENYMEQAELVYKKTEGLAPFSYVVIDEWIYFCDLYVPALFRYHYEKKICECVFVFNKKYINLNFYKIYVYKNNLWLLPFLDGKIICFNLYTCEAFYVSIPEEIDEKANPFSDMIFLNKKGYIIPHGKNRYLIEVDLASSEIKTIELIKTNEINKQIYFERVIEFENKIYLIDTINDILISYDINNGKKEIKTNLNIPKKTLPKKIDKKIFFLPIIIENESKNILIYDINANKIIKKENPISNFLKGEVFISEVFNKEIWILANKQKKIYRLNQNLEINFELSILNFNEDEKTIYVSSRVFEDRFFWHGHAGTPLLQVKDEKIQLLDVCKDTNFLNIFIKLVNKYNYQKKESYRFNSGKFIYKKLKI